MQTTTLKALLISAEILLNLLVFTSLSSPSWIYVKSEVQRGLRQTFGIFKSCVISEIELKWNNKTSMATCLHCMDTQDINFEQDVTSSGLTVSQVCAGVCMAAVLVTAIMLIAYVIVARFKKDSEKTCKIFLVLASVCAAITWLSLTLTCVFATRFFRQFQRLTIGSHEQILKATDVGYGKALSWITWVYSFVPSAIVFYATCRQFRKPEDHS